MRSGRRAWLAAACGALLATPPLREARANRTATSSESAIGGAGAVADPAAGHRWLAPSRRLGHGALRVWGMHVYDAALFVRTDFDAAAFASHPLVLELRYRRALEGPAIADFSLKEMRRQGELAEGDAERWLAFMRQAFPDVQPGDRLTGLWSPSEALSRFAANDGAPRELRDAAFGPRFFGIWLAPQTSRPDLRAQLLGMKAPS